MKKIFVYAYKNKNLGDDLFLRALCDRYQNVEFITLDYSNHIQSKSLRCINNWFFRYFRSRLYIPIARLIRVNPYLAYETWIKNQCDACVYIGGSVFQQAADWNQHKKKYLRTFRSKGPFFVLGANFGPFNDNGYYQFFYRLFEKNVFDITFRDTYSYQLFQDIPNTRYCPDILFGQNYVVPKIKEKTVGISILDLSNRAGLKNKKEAYLQALQRAIRYYLSKGYRITLFSFCKAEGDEKAIRAISERLSRAESNGVDVCYYDGDIDHFLNVFGSMEKIIATRFHAMTLAICMGKPVLPIIYNEKMSHVLEDLQFDGLQAAIEDIDVLDFGAFDRDTTLHVPNLEKVKSASARHFETLDKFIDKS